MHGECDSLSCLRRCPCRERLQQYTAQYKHVVLLGDSMGATATLLFAPLATHVLAFTPQAGQ